MLTIPILIQLLQALIAAYPTVKDGIELICKDLAEAHGIDPIALIKAVTTPDVQGVDTSIDAEIQTRWPQP